MSSFHAVVQYGYCILGVGESASDCVQDAVRRGVNPQALNQTMVHAHVIKPGCVSILPCTAALHRTVNLNGGDIAYRVVNNTVMLPYEDGTSSS